MLGEEINLSCILNRDGRWHQNPDLAFSYPVIGEFDIPGTASLTRKSP